MAVKETALIGGVGRKNLLEGHGSKNARVLLGGCEKNLLISGSGSDIGNLRISGDMCQSLE